MRKLEWVKRVAWRTTLFMAVGLLFEEAVFHFADLGVGVFGDFLAVGDEDDDFLVFCR